METQVKETLKLQNIKGNELSGSDLIKLIESKATVK